MQGSTQIKEALEQAKLEMETARRAGDLSRMSELQYGRIPELGKKIKPGLFRRCYGNKVSTQ